RLIFLGGVAAVGGAIAAFRFGILHDYQLKRIFTFLDPDSDPLGAGYHLLQSKIGLGSGGLVGKGYMMGTQRELNFLPEMQTDFIFTIFGEEFGFVGAIGLLLLYFAVIMTGMNIALRARSHFARLAALGICVTFGLYVLINAGMVMGLAPVVGVPLPLVSYGGTVMLTIMAGFGIVMSAHLSRDPDGASF
ncbi:MAG TPA: FtsW/RodA/SpoVE family cell cycle protein, partial [Parvularculaceae bacterium]|nr:FtsW/RodA/SpoVE family cell cycle protein [Parvularculaceae bacterium]